MANTYPTSYAKDTWENSVFSVAHQAFIVLGNGMEWAEDKHGNNLGYLTDPRNIKKNGEWFRKPDAPYGKIQWKGTDHLQYVGKDLYSWKHRGEYFHTADAAQIPDIYSASMEEAVKSFFSEKSGVKLDDLKYHRVHPVEKRRRREDPYPNFSRTYSPVWEVSTPLHIRPDWRQALLEHHEYWLTYFKYKSDAKLHVGTAEDYTGRWKDKTVEEVQRAWEVPMYDGANVQEAVDYLRQKYRDAAVAFLQDTVDFLRPSAEQPRASYIPHKNNEH